MLAIILLACTKDGIDEMSIINLPENTDPVAECFKEETAWADGDRYIEPGNWATYTTYEGVEQTVTLYAAESVDMGTVSFSSAADGMVTITIELDEGWSLRDDDEAVKIQGYNSPPSGNPAPGLFRTYKGTELSVTAPVFDFYGIHMDVKKAIECN